MHGYLQCWPRATITAGNMLKVADDEGVGVGGVALDADAVAAGVAVWVEGGDVVDAHEDLVVDDLVEALRECLVFADVVYKSACRVTNLLLESAFGRSSHVLVGLTAWNWNMLSQLPAL